MEKSKKRKIIILISLVVAIPLLLIGTVFAALHVFNSSKPDNSKDLLIPKGYIKTDGTQGYGAGDWEKFSYYVYENMPHLDKRFQPITDENKEEIKEIFIHYQHFDDAEDSFLNSNNLTQRISDGDYYYLDHINGEKNGKYGALIYYYDIQEKVLFKLDYCW